MGFRGRWFWHLKTGQFTGYFCMTWIKKWERGSKFVCTFVTLLQTNVHATTLFYKTWDLFPYEILYYCTIYLPAETTLAQAILAAITLTLCESQQEQYLQIINMLALAFGKLLFLHIALTPNLLPWLRMHYFCSFHSLMKHCMIFSEVETVIPSSTEGWWKQMGDLQDVLGCKTKVAPSIAALLFVSQVNAASNLRNTIVCA